MLRLTLLLIIVVLWLSTKGAAPQLLSECDQAHHAVCVATIVDTPSGVLNGVNPSFRLRLPPISLADVHVVVDGIELSAGKDYKVAGQDLLFQSTSVPRTNDVLRVSYQSQFADSTTSVDASPARDLDAIMNATLLRYATSRDHSYSASVTNQQVSPARAGRSDQMRSLSLLTERLAEETHNIKATGKGGGRAPILQGVDGLGDYSAATSYRAFGLLSPYGLVNGASLKRGNRDVHNVEGEPRSLIMLEERLGRCTQETQCK